MSFTTLILFEANNTDSLVQCLIDPFFFLAPIFVITYLGFWAKEKFFDKRQYFVYLLVAAALVALGVGIHEMLNSVAVNQVDNSIPQNIFNFIFFLLTTTGFQYLKRGIINQYQVQELKAKTAKTELNALKAQINPHFLFNTLNNIYGMNQIDSEKGSEMILELSDVMRYHLEFSKEGQVKLEDEIQLLQSYIKLEKLRLRETCDVQADFDSADPEMKISPLLFIPFVENAFKHGTHPTQDCYVHIKLSSNGKSVIFSVKNSKTTGRKVVKTNIGIQNTMRRLELIFPEKHNLNIVNNEVYHLVELTIDL